MTTKILALTDAFGNLVRFVLLPGQRFDTVGVPPLIEGLAFDALIADKAFDSNAIIADLDERGAKVVISQHPRRAKPLAIDAEMYKWRHLIENFFCKLKEFKRIAMRADKTDQSFAANILLAAARKDGTDFQLGRKTQRKRMKAKLREIKETLRRLRHTPIDEQGRWLGTMMTGYFAYFAVPTNTYLLSAFRYHTSIIWFRSLRRRGQRHRLTWERMIRLIKRFLPSPRVLHPWPNHRFHVKHSR